MPKSTPTRQRQPPNERPHDDSWVDQVADEVQALLAEQGLELELVVLYDRVTSVMHAVGFDGAPARFFASLPAQSDPTGPAPPAAPPGTGLPRTGQLPPALGPRSRGTPSGPSAKSHHDTSQPAIAVLSTDP